MLSKHQPDEIEEIRGAHNTIREAAIKTSIIVFSLAFLLSGMALIFGCYRLAAPPSPTSTTGKVKIPSGTFMMGCSPSDKECFSLEKPAHQVTLHDFWMDVTEVTNAAYQQCVSAGSCKASRYAKEGKLNGPSQPVVGIDWYDANDYCRWNGKRLPTEAEWEYAARAGTTGSRYGELDSVAWYKGNSGGVTHPVGQKQPNAWGLYDMLGNADEYCADNSHPLRGGSSWSNSLHVRVSCGGWGGPIYWNFTTGFRCVRD